MMDGVGIGQLASTYDCVVAYRLMSGKSSGDAAICRDTLLRMVRSSDSMMGQPRAVCTASGMTQAVHTIIQYNTSRHGRDGCVGNSVRQKRFGRRPAKNVCTKDVTLR